MGRIEKTLVLSLLLFGIVACGVYIVRAAAAAAVVSVEAMQKPQPPPARKPQSKPDAKALYVGNCARCHGADGRGDTPMGELYDVTNLADAAWWKKERPNDKRLAAAIRNGRGGMPAFGKKLSKEEINALVAFVKKFNGNK